MGRIMTYDEYMRRLSERVIDNTRELKRNKHQRRNGMEDLYGICFSGNGDAENPFKFYVSISPDMVYLERFAFKFVIRPFETTIKGATDSSTVIVDKTSLSVNNGSITPNPHDHTTQPHTHNVINGMSFVHTTSTEWSVSIAGYDITDYLQAQHDADNWLGARGEGIYPTGDLRSIHDFYDILEVCDMLTDEGDDEALEMRDAILSPAFKPVEIISDAPFGCDAYLYLKLSHVNR